MVFEITHEGVSCIAKEVRNFEFTGNAAPHADLWKTAMEMYSYYGRGALQNDNFSEQRGLPRVAKIPLTLASRQ